MSNALKCASLFDYHGNVSGTHSYSRNHAEGRSIYEGFFDQAVWRRIVNEHGGFEEVRFDMFTAPSTDGLQTFESTNYDCWPIAPLLCNFSGDRRYLVKNIVPLGFIKGPKEPEHVDTWSILLANEVREINYDGGSNLRFYGGVQQRTMVHIVPQNWISSLHQQTSWSNGSQCALSLSIL